MTLMGQGQHNAMHALEDSPSCFLKGRPVRQRYSEEGDAEKFIDPNDPWNTIVVFENSRHDESALKLSLGTFHFDPGTSTEEAGRSNSVHFLGEIITHLVDNWKNLLEIAAAHNVRLVSTLWMARYWVPTS